MTPGFGGGTRLTKLVGHRVATKLLVSGRIMLPNSAFDVGLCDAVFPEHEVCDVINMIPITVKLTEFGNISQKHQYHLLRNF